MIHSLQIFLKVEVLHVFTENVYIAQVVDMVFFIIPLNKTGKFVLYTFKSIKFLESIPCMIVIGNYTLSFSSYFLSRNNCIAFFIMHFLNWEQIFWKLKSMINVSKYIIHIVIPIEMQLLNQVSNEFCH